MQKPTEKLPLPAKPEAVAITSLKTAFLGAAIMAPLFALSPFRARYAEYGNSVATETLKGAGAGGIIGGTYGIIRGLNKHAHYPDEVKRVLSQRALNDIAGSSFTTKLESEALAASAKDTTR